MTAQAKQQPHTETQGVVLTNAIAEQVLYKIMNAPIREYPFPHFVVEDIWPGDFFDQIRAHMPETKDYSGIIASGRLGGYAEGTKDTRYLFSMEDHLHKLTGEKHAFWKSMADFMFGQYFYTSVLQKFLPYLQQRFRGQMGEMQVKPVLELFRDLSDYKIGPHSDSPARLLNLFFYLPEDDTKPHLGTSFYVPKDKSAKYAGGPHYNFEDFERVFTAPYKRNTMAAFFKNDISYHGVEPVMERNFERNALAYFMRVFDNKGNIPNA